MGHIHAQWRHDGFTSRTYETQQEQMMLYAKWLWECSCGHGVSVPAEITAWRYSVLSVIDNFWCMCRVLYWCCYWWPSPAKNLSHFVPHCVILSCMLRNLSLTCSGVCKPIVVHGVRTTLSFRRFSSTYQITPKMQWRQCTWHEDKHRCRIWPIKDAVCKCLCSLKISKLRSAHFKGVVSKV